MSNEALSEREQLREALSCVLASLRYIRLWNETGVPTLAHTIGQWRGDWGVMADADRLAISALDVATDLLDGTQVSAECFAHLRAGLAIRRQQKQRVADLYQQHLAEQYEADENPPSEPMPPPF